MWKLKRVCRYHPKKTNKQTSIRQSSERRKESWMGIDGGDLGREAGIKEDELPRHWGRMESDVHVDVLWIVMEWFVVCEGILELQCGLCRGWWFSFFFTFFRICLLLLIRWLRFFITRFSSLGFSFFDFISDLMSFSFCWCVLCELRIFFSHLSFLPLSLSSFLNAAISINAHVVHTNSHIHTNTHTYKLLHAKHTHCLCLCITWRAANAVDCGSDISAFKVRWSLGIAIWEEGGGGAFSYYIFFSSSPTSSSSFVSSTSFSFLYFFFFFCLIFV